MGTDLIRLRISSQIQTLPNLAVAADCEWVPMCLPMRLWKIAGMPYCMPEL